MCARAAMLGLDRLELLVQPVVLGVGDDRVVLDVVAAVVVLDLSRQLLVLFAGHKIGSSGSSSSMPSASAGVASGARANSSSMNG